MDAIEPGPWEINEDDITQSQARVRALQIKRYEEVWNEVEARISDSRDGTRPLDPRLLEIGIRVLREEALIYRLHKTQGPSEDEEDPEVQAVDRHALISRQLTELETRRKEQEAAEQARRSGNIPADSTDPSRTNTDPASDL